MYLRRKVDAFLGEWKHNLIRPFIEKWTVFLFAKVHFR